MARLYAEVEQPRFRVGKECACFIDSRRRRIRSTTMSLAHIVLRLLRVECVSRKYQRRGCDYSTHADANTASHPPTAQNILQCPHAPTPCGFAAASCKITSACSICASLTSQCVTNRTEYCAVSCAHNPRA